jgi:hypothetical protein
MGIREWFRRRSSTDKTTIQLTKSNVNDYVSVYVEAQTSEKATELIEKFVERKK